MKLKKIASICGKRKMVEICHVGKEQYIGNEYALYLVPPDLKLTRENTLVVFDVAEKKRDDWFINFSVPSQFDFSDVIDGEEQAEIYPFNLVCGESEYCIIHGDSEIVMIDTEYLSPLADLNEGMSFCIRTAKDGRKYVAIKEGLWLCAVITSFNQIVIKRNFVNQLADLTMECKNWFKENGEEKQEEGQVWIDPLTGEVKD